MAFSNRTKPFVHRKIVRADTSTSHALYRVNETLMIPIKRNLVGPLQPLTFLPPLRTMTVSGKVIKLQHSPAQQPGGGGWRESVLFLLAP
jgi:hypothetical protein